MPAYLPNLAFQPYVEPSTGGEPIKELSDLGTTLNGIYDKSIAQQDALDEHIAQLKATVNPIDHPLVDAVEQGTRSDLADIRQNGNWENAQIPLRAASKRLLANPALMVAQQNAATRQKLDEYNAQAQAQGHHLIQFADYNNTPSVNSDGTFNKLTAEGVFDKKLDYESKMHSIFDGLEANSTAYKNSSPQRDESTGAIYQIGSGASKRYINTKMVQNVVANNLDNYLNTDEGQQRLRVLTTWNSDNPTPMSHLDAVNQIKNELTNVGLTRRFNDSSSESSEKLAPQKATKTTPDGTTLVTDTSYQQNQGLGDLIDAMDKKNRISVIVPKASDVVANNIPDFAPASQLKTEVGYGNIPAKLKPVYDNISSLFSNIKDEDKKNAAIKNYLTNINTGKIQPVLAAYNTTKGINEANSFFGNGAYESTEFLDPNTHEKLSWQEIKDKYENSDTKKPITDKDATDAKVVGQYSPDNPFYDMTGNDPQFSTSKKVIIGGHTFVAGANVSDKQSSDYQLNEVMAKISQARRIGQPVTIGSGLKITPGPNNEGYYIQQGNGTPRGKADGKPLSLSDIMDNIVVPHNIGVK